MALPEATAAPDSAENVAKFYDALRELVGDDPRMPKPVASIRTLKPGEKRAYTFG
jgi:hypothetical protein